MKYKTIKISQDNYTWLLRESTALQSAYKKKVSLNEAITHLRCAKVQNLIECAGGWSDMTDEEAEQLKKEIKEGWTSWKSA